MKVSFTAEKGNHGIDNVIVLLSGIRDLPKFMLITAEDFMTPIGTCKVEIKDNELVVGADLREEEFDLYPTIGFECLLEENIDGQIIVKESLLHTISLQSTPNLDPEIKTINEQIKDGTARVYKPSD